MIPARSRGLGSRARANSSSPHIPYLHPRGCNLRRGSAALPVPGADRLRGAPVTGSCRPRAGGRATEAGCSGAAPAARPPRGAFLRAARHPAHERRPADRLYGLVCGEGSAAVCYGEPLRGAAPGSEPNSGTTPPSPRSRRYGSPMRVDHSVSHDAPGLRRSAVSIMKECTRSMDTSPPLGKVFTGPPTTRTCARRTPRPSPAGRRRRRASGRPTYVDP